MSGQSIARSVLGITERHGDMASLEAHEALTKEVLTPEALAAEYARRDGIVELLTTGSYDGIERFHSLQIVAEILRGETASATALLDWPTYQDMMDQYGTKADGSGRSLLIGSLCSLSSRAFEVMSQEVLGAASPYIIDLVSGKDKRLHGEFVEASGLELPFKSGSMHFVATNRLLHKLNDPRQRPQPVAERAESLLGEIHRVLAPGGQLLMVEQVSGCRKADSEEERTGKVLARASQIGQILSSRGLDDIWVGQADVPLDYEYLFDPERDFAATTAWRASKCFRLYATKPG